EKRYGDAVASLDKYLSIKPDDAAALFEKAFILLTAIEDREKGLSALTASLKAGFHDAERIKALTEYPDLLYSDDIQKIILQYEQPVPPTE
ncbi:MAG TPA: hypothetical protein PLG43_12790, partial [Spirochaetia bacterium]|nr:hypothetical protein [Spirochaetia bacterium]